MTDTRDEGRTEIRGWAQWVDDEHWLFEITDEPSMAQEPATLVLEPDTWDEAAAAARGYPIAHRRAPTSDTEDVGDEELIGSAIDLEGWSDWLVERIRRPAEIPHYGPDADGFWLLRRCDVIALLEGREPLATQDPNAGEEDG